MFIDIVTPTWCGIDGYFDVQRPVKLAWNLKLNDFALAVGIRNSEWPNRHFVTLLSVALICLTGLQTNYLSSYPLVRAGHISGRCGLGLISWLILLWFDSHFSPVWYHYIYMWPYLPKWVTWILCVRFCDFCSMVHNIEFSFKWSQNYQNQSTGLEMMTVWSH